MKFATPAGTNPIDHGNVVGKPTPRIDGKFKTTGTAPYAYERNDEVDGHLYGFIVGAGIARGTLRTIDTREAEAAPGVRTIVTHHNAGKIAVGSNNTAKLLGGPEIEHYHQAIAIVVADGFEQARAAAALIRTEYDRSPGSYDLRDERSAAPVPDDNGLGGPARTSHGDFAAAYADAPVKLDGQYSTPGESHAMMEPFASIAKWDGGKLTLFTSNQMIGWGVGDVAETLGIAESDVRLDSPFIGGGFGGKLFVRADAVLAALGARAAGRPVKVAMQRPLMINNATHRPATEQRIRIGCDRDGTIVALAHQSWSGNMAGARPEDAVAQSQLIYAGANRMTELHLARLDLPEGNAMRAPGEAPGLMALEIAMDEMAEKLGMDPVEFRIKNDTQVDPERPERPFSERHLVECLRTGAEKFGWEKRNPKPAQTREGDWLIGYGMAAGIRNSMTMKSAARVTLDKRGVVTVETDMTDIGTGTYTIIAQTAAEMMGVDLDAVVVRLGNSDDPTSCGSGGQFGAANSTSGVYAACIQLRDQVAQKLGVNSADAQFADGHVISGNRRLKLGDAAKDGDLSAEDAIEYGKLDEEYQLSTFAGHFVEVAVDAYTGETRIRRMLAVCDAGRILNPVSARSQVIGAMTMGAGAALMEELAVDARFGFFVNHDLASYEVPVHADIPHQDVIFLDYPDDKASPMKAKGVGELGLCGVGAAIANAIYNATGVRVRDYPVTLEKHLEQLPAMA